MSERYEVMRKFTRGFGAAITLSEGYSDDCPHFKAGYEAGYPLRKVKNEKLNEYLVSTGREPQAVIKLVESSIGPKLVPQVDVDGLSRLIEKWRDESPKDQPSLSDFNDGKMVAYSLCITDLSIALAALRPAPAASEEAIDEAWLRSIGFVDMTFQDRTELVLRFKVLADTQWIEVGPASYSHGLFTIHRFSDTHADSDMPPDFVEVKAKTRAALLRLLSALNIPLQAKGEK